MTVPVFTVLGRHGGGWKPGQGNLAGSQRDAKLRGESQCPDLGRDRAREDQSQQMRRRRAEHDRRLLMNRLFLLAFSFGALSGYAGAEPVRRLGIAPPRTCAVTRGAYCIERSGLVIRIERAGAARSRITAYQEWWKDFPLIIEEPASCRRTLSDTVELMAMSEDNMNLRFTLKLARNNRCNIIITVPNEQRDPAGSAVFTALGQIRACARRPCNGPIVGMDIRERFGWRFN